MKERSILSLAAFALLVTFVEAACAQQATAPPVSVDGATVLTTLFLCGLMGLLGQGCRVIVGMATLATSKLVAPADNQDVFNLARLVFSLIIGFVAGLVTALIRWKQGPITSINVADFDVMFPFAIAGYIGTDVIEAFTVQFFEKNRQDSQRASTSAASATNTTPQPASASDTLTDVHAMVSSIADRVGDATSPISKFKAKSPAIMAELMNDFALSDVQAAGILGNIGVECNGFTQMQEVHPAGGGPGGYGWAQWTGPRRTQYMTYCQRNNLDKDSDAANYGFMKSELSTDYKRVITHLKSTQTVVDATTVVLQQYEGAGVPATARRIAWANMALTAYRGEQV